jgi:SAM-dependent methyltransferase
MPILANLRRRERIAELMDDPGLDAHEHRRALNALARINRVSRSAGVLWPSVRKLALQLKRPLRVLDVATGSGDVPAALLARADRARLPMQVAGCDISPLAISIATSRYPQGRFFVHNVLREPLPAGYDVVTCSLFLHHLSSEEADILLRRLKDAADHLVLVNDLARSRFNYLSVWLACRTLTRSRVVWFDGPASVRSAFTPGEARALAEHAGLTGVTVRPRFPSRFLLTWAHGLSS